MRRDVIGTAVLGLGVYQVAIGLFIAIAPHAFFDSLGPYGHFNRHYVHDVAAFEGALGAGLLLAVRRPAWRAPLLAIAALHFAFHAISHGVDISRANPKWVGPVEFAGLVGGAALLVLLARRAQAEAGERRDRGSP